MGKSELIVHGNLSVSSDALSSSADHSSCIPQVITQQIISLRLLCKQESLETRLSGSYSLMCICIVSCLAFYVILFRKLFDPSSTRVEDMISLLNVHVEIPQSIQIEDTLSLSQ